MKQSIYIDFQGGLGNQLYQLAYADQLKRKFGVLPRMFPILKTSRAYVSGQDRKRRDLFYDLVEYLGIPYLEQGSWEFKIAYFLKRRVAFYREGEKEQGCYLEDLLPPLRKKPLFRIPTHIRICGYFQSYRYLSAEFVAKIRNFLEHVSLSPALQSIAEAIGEDDVAIHFRRGDFLKVPELYPIFGADHYLEGLSRLASKQKVGKVYVFSDDFEAIVPELEELGRSYELVKVEGGTTYQDLSLLSRFRRYVLAGSTFSWWGAFCSRYGEQVEVVVPEKPLLRNHPNDSYFPPHWIKLPTKH